MNKCLDYYRGLLKDVPPDQYGKSLYNIMNTYRLARGGRLSGMIFDGIDFGNVPLNDLHFSDDGENPTEFKNCKFHELNFMTGHSANVTHTALSISGKYALTLDALGILIFWETDSGLQLDTYKLGVDIENVLALAVEGDDEETAVFVVYNRYGIRYCFDRTTLNADWTWENLLPIEFSDYEVVLYSPDKTLALIHNRRERELISQKYFYSKYSPTLKTDAISYNRKKDLSLYADYYIYDLKNRRPITKITSAIGKGDVSHGKALEGKNTYEVASFSADNCFFAKKDYNCMIRLWNVKTGEEIHPLLEECKQTWLTCTKLVLSSVGGCITTNEWNELKYYDVAAGTVKNFELPVSGWIQYIMFSPNGKQCLVVGTDRCCLWKQAEDFKILEEYRAASPFWGTPNFANGCSLCITAFNHSAAVWNMKTGKIQHKLGGNVGKYKKYFSPNANYCVCLSQDGGEYDNFLWNLKTKTIVRRFHENTILRGGEDIFSSDERLFVIWNWEEDDYKKLNLFESETGKLISSIKAKLPSDINIFWSIDRKDCFIQSKYGSNQLYIWNIENESISDVYVSGCGPFFSAVLSRNRKYCLCCMRSGDVEVCALDTDWHRQIYCEELKNKDRYLDDLVAVCVSDDGEEGKLYSGKSHESLLWCLKKTPIIYKTKLPRLEEVEYYKSRKCPALFSYEWEMSSEFETKFELLPRLYIENCRFEYTIAKPEVLEIIRQYRGKIISLL